MYGNTIYIYIIMIMNKLKLERNERILEKIKKMLKDKKITFAELAEKIEYTSTGLNRAFGKNNLKLETLERISEVLQVDITYFFEEELTDRLVDEIMKHEQNPDLKGFMFGFSRDISKGMKLEEAVFKNMDKQGYLSNLLL